MTLILLYILIKKSGINNYFVFLNNMHFLQLFDTNLLVSNLY